MDKLPELIEALEEAAKTLSASARRLRREKSPSKMLVGPELAEADRTILELHHRIVYLLGEHAASTSSETASAGEIGLDELTRLLYRNINPPESRRNYTYTPPFSIEKVLRAYLSWMTGPGKGVNVRGA